jgi:hypothetical protein
MRIATFAAFVAAVCAGSASIAAQQPSNGAPLKAGLPANLFAPKRNASGTPRFLFPTPVPRVDPARGGRPATTPTVVCGLTLIPGDPRVDPAIRHEVPENGATFAIRSVDPKVCQRP